MTLLIAGIVVLSQLPVLQGFTPGRAIIARLPTSRWPLERFHGGRRSAGEARALTASLESAGDQDSWWGAGDTSESSAVDAARRASTPKFVAEDLVKGTYTYEVELGAALGLTFEERASGDGKNQEAGVYISAVVAGGSGEAGGVCVDDRVVATSATVGSDMWEKRTKTGVLSAVRTRLAVAPTVRMRFERALAEENLRVREEREEVWDVIVRKPLGMSLIQEELGGPVVVSEVEKGGSADVAGIQKGDAIVAVSNSLGSRMWNTRSVDGVISAVTTNIWADGVQMRLRRRIDTAEKKEGHGEAAAAVGATKGAASDLTVTDVDRKSQRHELNLHMMSMIAKGRASEAVEAFDKAVISGMAPNVQLHTTLMKAYGRLRQPNKCVELIQRLKSQKDLPQNYQVDVTLINAAFSAISSGSAKVAQKFFREILEPGAREHFLHPDWKVQPDTYTFNIMLNVLVKQRKHARAKALFESMLKLGVKPDVVSFTALVRMYVSLQNLDGAAKTVRTMVQDFRIQPDRRLYHVLVEGYCSLQQVDKAESTFMAMARSSTPPSVVTYGVMMVAQIRTGRYAGVLEKYDALLEDDLKPNQYIYSSVILAYAKLGDLVGALSILREMRQRGHEPQLVVYTSIVEACLQNSQPDLALQIFDEMELAGLRPDPRALATLSRAHLLRNDLKSAVDVMDDLENDSVPKEMAAPLIAHAVAAGDYDTAEVVLKRYVDGKRGGTVPRRLEEALLRGLQKEDSGDGADADTSDGAGVEICWATEYASFLRRSADLLLEGKFELGWRFYKGYLRSCINSNLLHWAAAAAEQRKAGAWSVRLPVQAPEMHRGGEASRRSDSVNKEKADVEYWEEKALRAWEKASGSRAVEDVELSGLGVTRTYQA